MSENFVGEVKFSVTPQLAPWNNDPSDCVLQIKARVFVFKPVQDKVEQVGSMKSLLVRASEAMNEGFRLPIVADSHDQELCDAYCSTFNDEEFKEDLGITCPWLDFLLLTQWRLLRLYRRSTLAVQAIRTMIATFQPEGVLIARRNIGLTRADQRELGFKEAGTDFLVTCDNGKRPDALTNGA